jgi:hypothetical protein
MGMPGLLPPHLACGDESPGASLDIVPPDRDRHKLGLSPGNDRHHCAVLVVRLWFSVTCLVQ